MDSTTMNNPECLVSLTRSQRKKLKSLLMSITKAIQGLGGGMIQRNPNSEIIGHWLISLDGSIIFSRNGEMTCGSLRIATSPNQPSGNWSTEQWIPSMT